jgi:hypothetical protein
MESKAPKEIINKEIISTFLPLFAGFAIIFGITYNIVLYRNFNIDITGYIDLSESLILFLPELPLIIVFLPFTLFAFTILTAKGDAIEQLYEFPFYMLFYKGDNTPNKRVFIWTLIVMVVVLLALLIARQYVEMYATLLIFFTLIVPFYFLLIRDTIFRSRVLALSIHLLVFLFICIFFNAELRTRRILHNSRTLPNLIIKKKDGSLLMTDNIVRYVGKTKSHIFLYNADYKTTTAIPDEAIAEITYQKKDRE